MSEGKIYYSNGANNLTLYIGSLEIKFHEGRYPKNGKPETRPEYIAAIENSPEYGSVIESQEDRDVRMAPDPKAEAALIEKALEVVAKMPGVIPARMPRSEEPPKNPEPQSEQLVRVPSLTEVSKMNKTELKLFCEAADIEVTDSDTLAILKKKVRAWIKAEAS